MNRFQLFTITALCFGIHQCVGAMEAGAVSANGKQGLPYRENC